MKEEYREFARRFARAVIDEDFEAAHALFAPWLQTKISPNDFRGIIEKWLWEMNEVWGIEELIFPAAFDIDGNSSTLSSLKNEQDWREPRKISD